MLRALILLMNVFGAAPTFAACGLGLSAVGNVRFELARDEDDARGVYFEVAKPSLDVHQPGVYKFEFVMKGEEQVGMGFYDPDFIEGIVASPFRGLLVNDTWLRVGDSEPGRTPTEVIVYGINRDGTVTFAPSTRAEFAQRGLRVAGRYEQTRFWKGHRLIVFTVSVSAL